MRKKIAAWRWLRISKRAARDERGTTAIEFGILALPFFLLTFAIAETTVSFTAEQVLANTINDISRQLRTGEIRPGPPGDPNTIDENEFRALICGRLDIIVGEDCPGLLIDVRSYSGFADVPTSIPFSEPGVLDESQFIYAPGPGDQISNLRVAYEWPVITDIMKSRLSNLEGGKTLLYATVTWQNEDF